MDFIKKLKLIERIDGMISRKSTGTPGELSNKIGVSERTLYNIIATMKLLGAPIFYSSARMSYCYEGSVSFSFVFRIEEDKKESAEPELKVEEENIVAIDKDNVKKLQRTNMTFGRVQGFRSAYRLGKKD